MTLSDVLKDIAEHDTFFKDRDVLRSDKLPESIDYIVHRDEEIILLGQQFKDVIKGITPTNILMLGKHGTGKTLIARLTLNLYQNMAKEKGQKCLVIFIPCDSVKADAHILRNIISYLEMEMKIPHKKCPNSIGEYFEMVITLLNQYGGTVIIIFDEADLMKNPNLLGSFSRIRENKQYAKGVCIVCISNDLKYNQLLDSRTSSSFSMEEIILQPYDALQIQDILQDRANRGLIENCLDEMVIPLCSAKAAQEHGDARKAIDLFRKSIEIAETKKHEIVMEEDVEEADLRLETEIIAGVVKGLPIQSKVTILSVIYLRQAGRMNVTTGEVYQVYRQICLQIDLDILTQRRVTDLISELDMLGILNAVVRAKGRYGRTKEVCISVPIQLLMQKLHEDYRLDKVIDRFKPIITSQYHL